MLTNEMFVRYSMELNLFFMRIMKEHLIFIEASLTQKNQNIARQVDVLKNEANMLLNEMITFSRGLIGPDVLNSGELVTKYTSQAEFKTQLYTGIHIDSRLTASELTLAEGPAKPVTQAVLQGTLLFNQRATNLVMTIIALKEKLHDDVDNCSVFTNMYPHMLDHVIREAKFYLGMLLRLHQYDVIDTERELLEQEIFWNNILGDHAKFMRGGFDQTEEQLINIANMFAKSFDELDAEGKNLQAQRLTLDELTGKSIEEAISMREFNDKGVDGMLKCEVKSILLPLLADHTLRETNHYIRVLNEYKSL